MNKETVSIGDKGAMLTCYLHEFKQGDVKALPAILIIPGGAYFFTSEREADPVALTFLNAGYNAYVLEYATSVSKLQSEGKSFDEAMMMVHDYIEKSDTLVSAFPNPVVEAALAMQYIRKHHVAHHSDPDRVFTVGFSAGGNLAGLLGAYWNAPWLNDLIGSTPEKIKPNAQILAYGVLDPHALIYLGETPEEQEKGHGLFLKAMSNTSSPSVEVLDALSPLVQAHPLVPRSFIWHTKEDSLVPVKHSMNYAVRLNELGVDFELHIYEKGAHGLSVANAMVNTENPHVASWIPLVLSWLDLDKKREDM